MLDVHAPDTPLDDPGRPLHATDPDSAATSFHLAMPHPLTSLFSPIHCDAPAQPASVSRAVTALRSVKSAIAVPESELKRWRRIFDSNAQTVINDEK